MSAFMVFSLRACFVFPYTYNIDYIPNYVNSNSEKIPKYFYFGFCLRTGAADWPLVIASTSARRRSLVDWWNQHQVRRG